MLIGRICLSAIFILSGLGKFVDYPTTAAYMASKGMTLIPVFLYGAGLIELIGGLSILLGFMARWGAALLMVYLIPVTFIFHSFWNVSVPAMATIEMIMFMKNLAIFGGLWFVISCGAGGCSCDACSCKKTAELKRP
jgi:putative oxidoreductase